ncbi:DDE_3 domain-containing protein [Trichonephila clavipes]|nr:DDE_3 domain-containing protein [Trichonephila clavipes]
MIVASSGSDGMIVASSGSDGLRCCVMHVFWLLLRRIDGATTAARRLCFFQNSFRVTNEESGTRNLRFRWNVSYRWTKIIPLVQRLLLAYIDTTVLNTGSFRQSGVEPMREQHLIQRVKHPQKQMFWGYFTSGGSGSLAPFEGVMNSKHYISILESKIGPIMQTFAGGVGIVQHNLAPCHTSKITTI